MSVSISHDLTLNHVALSLSDPLGSDEQQQQMERRVTRALEQLSIHPAMPPAAILVVRHLPDAKPGHLLANDSVPGQRAWEQATQNALTACWQTAYRPVNEAVPASANSVWFTDAAEWLACLSVDVQRGMARNHWWWEVPLQPYDYHSKEKAIAALWQVQAQWVPAAVRMLCRRYPAEVVRVLAGFSPSSTEAVLNAIARAYDFSLPASSKLIIQRLTAHIPEAATAFMQGSVEIQALVALAWSLPAAVQLLNAPTSVEFTRDKADSERAEADVVQGYAEEVTDRVERNDGDRLRTTTVNELEDSLSDERARQESEDNEPATVGASVESSTDNTESAEEAVDSTGILTELGGIWYLVNVLSALDWPGSSAAITPWHQLLALSQRLLPEEFLDPVWEILMAQAVPPCSHDLLEQWSERAIAQVLPYLADRLDAPMEIARYLREPAMLYFTETHVDVVFRLDQIRLDLRIAGLDQDPGWVPALGRAIAFYYE